MKVDNIGAICIECGEKYNTKRKKLGYQTCLDCGGIKAKKEIERKSKCTAPAYNKGAYMYVTSTSVAKMVGK